MKRDLKKNEKIFLSIIIPLYNPNLIEFKRCIDSVANISLPHEIVVVDDGSDDGVSTKCENYVGKLVTARYVKKNNGGVSSARNCGIDKSKGRYILFLDVDDQLSLELVEYLNYNYKKINADWIWLGVEIREIQKKTVLYRSIIEKKHFINNKEMFKISYEDAIRLRAETKELNESWGKLVKRDILEQYEIRFPDGVLSGEDAWFNTKLLNHVEKIQCIPIYGYIYNYEPRLAERVLANPVDRYLYFFKAEEELKNLICEKGEARQVDELVKGRKNIIIVNLVQDCMILIKGNQFSKEVKEVLCSQIEKYGLFGNFNLFNCNGIKCRCYYILLKYKMWLAINGIIKVKQILKR